MARLRNTGYFYYYTKVVPSRVAPSSLSSCSRENSSFLQSSTQNSLLRKIIKNNNNTKRKRTFFFILTRQRSFLLKIEQKKIKIKTGNWLKFTVTITFTLIFWVTVPFTFCTRIIIKSQIRVRSVATGQKWPEPTGFGSATLSRSELFCRN